MTSRDFIKLEEVKHFQDSHNFVRNVDSGQHVHYELEPDVDTVGIYIENHEGPNRECFIWIRIGCEIWISEGSGILGGPSDFPIMSPGGECFAPLTPRDGIALDFKKLNCSRCLDFGKNVAVRLHMWSESEPRVDTVGIYVENHHGKCREFFIWIRFDHKTLGEKGSIPLLLEDPLILK